MLMTKEWKNLHTAFYKRVRFTDLERMKVIEWLERKVVLDNLDDNEEEHINDLLYELLTELEGDGTVPEDYKTND